MSYNHEIVIRSQKGWIPVNFKELWMYRELLYFLAYVDDLIEGMVRLMNSPDEFIGPVNLGNPVEFSILELAEKVIYLTSSKSKITFKPLPEDDPMQRKPDISLAMKVLDWQPKMELEDGLSKTIDYFKAIL